MERVFADTGRSTTGLRARRERQRGSPGVARPSCCRGFHCMGQRAVWTAGDDATVAVTRGPPLRRASGSASHSAVTIVKFLTFEQKPGPSVCSISYKFCGQSWEAEASVRGD